MIIDGYVRVSQVRGRGGDSFISPVVQREQIEAWAALNGSSVGVMFKELDRSGGSWERPMLAEAIDRVERGLSDGIVVAKLDRFGRSLVESLQAIERIREAGGTFAAVQDGLDLNTETGRLALCIMLSTAEWQLDRIREQWHTARSRAVDHGVHAGARAPFGYERDRQTRRLRPHPVRGPVVTELFSRRADGASLGELAAWLHAAGVQTAAGDRQWWSTSLSIIVRNRAYLGELHNGDLVNRAANPPLTDPVTWQAAQAPRRLRPAPHGAPTLLAGLVRCASVARATIHERRRAIATLVDCVFVADGALPVSERVRIVRSGEGPIDLASSGERDPDRPAAGGAWHGSWFHHGRSALGHPPRQGRAARVPRHGDFVAARRAVHRVGTRAPAAGGRAHRLPALVGARARACLAAATHPRLLDRPSVPVDAVRVPGPAHHLAEPSRARLARARRAATGDGTPGAATSGRRSSAINAACRAGRPADAGRRVRNARSSSQLAPSGNPRSPRRPPALGVRAPPPGANGAKPGTRRIRAEDVRGGRMPRTRSSGLSGTESEQAAAARPSRYRRRLRVIPSRMCATCSQASTLDSSDSKMSFQRITTIGSMPATKREAIASRLRRSASFSSR